MANETNGDLGNTWLKTHSAGSGPYRLVSWKANESVTLEANPDYHLGAAAYEARDRPPCSRARHAAPAAREGRHRHRAEPAPDQLTPLANNKDIKIESFPYSRTPGISA